MTMHIRAIREVMGCITPIDLRDIGHETHGSVNLRAVREGNGADRSTSGGRWITVRPNGPDEKGRPVLIDGDGRVLGGMGGRFNGQPLGSISRHVPAHEPNAQWNTHTERFKDLGPDVDTTVHGTPIYRHGAWTAHVVNPHLEAAATAGHALTPTGYMEPHPAGGVTWTGPTGQHDATPTGYQAFARQMSQEAVGHVLDHLERVHRTNDEEEYRREAERELTTHRAASMKNVRDFIRHSGGIAPHRKLTNDKFDDHKSNEYSQIPRWAKGLSSHHTMDTMAAAIAERFPDLGIDDEDGLREYIMQHERERVGGYTRPAREAATPGTVLWYVPAGPLDLRSAAASGYADPFAATRA